MRLQGFKALRSKLLRVLRGVSCSTSVVECSGKMSESMRSLDAARQGQAQDCPSGPVRAGLLLESLDLCHGIASTSSPEGLLVADAPSHPSADGHLHFSLAEICLGVLLPVPSSRLPVPEIVQRLRHALHATSSLPTGVLARVVPFNPVKQVPSTLVG